MLGLSFQCRSSSRWAPAAAVDRTNCAPSKTPRMESLPNLGLVEGTHRGGDGHTEPLLHESARGLGALLAPRGQDHLGTLLGQHHRGPLADRARPAQHHGLLAGHRAVLGEVGDGGGGGGVAAIAVEHHGDPKIGEEFLLDRLDERLPIGQVAAADE